MKILSEMVENDGDVYVKLGLDNMRQATKMLTFLDDNVEDRIRFRRYLDYNTGEYMFEITVTVSVKLYRLMYSVLEIAE